MDGYSVKDAAIVLGIPERRVWELLARGVLAGAPEGPDGMIVYLQPRGASAPVAPAQGTAEATAEATGAKANGNGGSPELSPFRELLTEFRNLTERYGQALLALGEARGEVASLRTRVELLEARVDLRLPSAPPTSPVAWEIPAFAPEAGTAAAADFEDALAGEDEPAAEPMIDLVEEAIFAEELLAEEEPIAEPLVDEIAAADTAAEEMPVPDPATEDVAFEAEPPAAEEEAVVALVEPEIEIEVEPEPTAAAMPLEPEAAPQEEVDTPRRRARGGRTATAAFAAALARADDPTIAELPGAEETAAALAALQREIDASRTSEAPPAIEAVPSEPEAVADSRSAAESELVADRGPVSEPELEPDNAVAEPDVIEGGAAAAATEAEHDLAEAVEPAAEIDAGAGEEIVEASIEEAAAADEVSAAAETSGPPQASVPSYYSTDVVEPDWFADGDFSWLESAQAEAIRLEAEQAQSADASSDSATGVVEAADAEAIPEADPQPPEVVAERPAVPEPVSMPQSDESPDIPVEEGGDLPAVVTDAGSEATHVSTETAFGDHPDTDATPPDVAHDRFEPSVESQALVEEQARSAIQDAFEEAPASLAEESPIASSVGVAAATAVAEPEVLAEPEVVAEPDAFSDEGERPIDAEAMAAEVADVPEAVSHQDSVEAGAIQDAFEPPDQAADSAEAMAAEVADVPEAVSHQDSVEAGAIQDAFEPPDQAAEDSARAASEADVEADAIQDAFEEPTPAPEWSAAAPEATDPVLGQTPTTDDVPRTSDESPGTAVAAAPTFRGPEEFIAPPAPVAMPAPAVMPTDPTPPTETQPKPASGEEELMWLGEEFEEADLEVAAQGWRSPDVAQPVQAAPSPVLELSDAELARLAEDEGWDADEVEAIRRLLGRPSDAPPSAPDAGLEASSSSGEQPRPSTGGSAVPTPPIATPNPDAAATDGTPPRSSRPPANGSDMGAEEAPDPEWLQGRSGAAAEAYRRLRKLFPS